MVSANTVHDEESRHSEDMQDVISAVPSWLLRWGITLFFGILVLIVGLSALIKYPDIVNAQLKIDSQNAPKPIVSKISGKLTKLLITENETVKAGQPLAYLESTANHDKVLALLTNLKAIQQQAVQNITINSQFFNSSNNIQLGELQASYQVFFQEYLNYISTIGNGFLVKKGGFLKKDLSYLSDQQHQLSVQQTIQKKDYAIAGEEYVMHKNLEQQKVETPAELRQEESKYLAKKTAVLQTESLMITGNNNYATKQSEISELNNQIQQEKAKFLQALNSLISSVEDWKSKYVLIASVTGKLSFSGMLQENQVLSINQEVFYINPGDEAFYGEMAIAQSNMGKVNVGQQVLVKLRSYPFEEYGMIRGRIKHISDIPYKDSVFISRVSFKTQHTSDLKKRIRLKQGMVADAEIITEDATILQRLTRNMIKIFKKE